MNEVINELLLSITFTLFGMLLIFGLGFVFPQINPYVVIKWIIIVCATVFVYAIVMYLLRHFGIVKPQKGEAKKAKEVKRARKK